MANPARETLQAADALRAAYQILDGVINAIPARVFWKDRDLVYLGCNANFARDAGFTDAKEIIGKDEYQMGWLDQAELYRSDDRNVIETGCAKLLIEEPQTDPEGNCRTLLTSKLPMRGPDGEICGIIGTYMDITERKLLESRLLEVSRYAGMAEVASAVLHNVGNVANSVNISANIFAEQVRTAPVADLARIVALLREQGAGLGGFFTSDPRGPKVLEFLYKLAEMFTGLQAAQLQEISLLQKNIDYIKDIVATQQSYAHFSGLVEELDVTDLVEDTLRIKSANFPRHEVQVVREFAPELPAITTERHKVLQILVNLLTNAKAACDASPHAGKQIKVRVAHAGGRVSVQVIDNGVGICSENLDRIFNHGFTTKLESRGFGLHNAANMAKEIGGSLSVQSSGPGSGATFTLELPIHRENGAK